MLSAIGLPITITSPGVAADAPAAPLLPAGLADRLAESFTTPAPWVPQFWRGVQDSPFGPGAFPFAASGTTSDRRGGRDLPLFWSELDLNGFRVLSRFLCDTNGFAIGFLGRLTDYHVRKGYGWQACLAGVRKTPYAATDGTPTDPLVAKAQALLDRWRDQNMWPVRSREAFRRWRRDGEVFGRFFLAGGYGRLSTFRFVEPEQVGSPTGDTDGDDAFGVACAGGDSLDPREYHVWDLQSPTRVGEWVGADRIVHAKANVDSTVRRGLPDFFPLHDQLDGVRRLLQAALTTSIRQAKVAWMERFPTATGEQVRALVPQVATGSGSSAPAYAAAGQWGPWPPGTYPFPGSGNGFPPDGTVVRVEGNREFEPGPSSAGVPNYIQVEQAILRGCGARWGMPEYFSGDASNNNFASSLVAGSPFAVAVEGCQLEWGACWEKPVAVRVLDLAVAAGLLSPAERARLDVEVVEPAVVSPDPAKDAQVYEAWTRNKWACLDTVRLKLGLDPQHEAEGLKKDAAVAAQQQQQQPQQQPPGDPAAAGGSPPAGDDLTGLLGEAVVTEAALGLLSEAGRAGLVPKQITDKLGRKRTVYVRGEPKPAGSGKAAAKKAAAETGRAAAHKVLAAPHEATAADVSGLVGHLSALTVPELQALREKYGVGGKDRKKEAVKTALLKYALEKHAAARRDAAARAAEPTGKGGEVVPHRVTLPPEAIEAGRADRAEAAQLLTRAGFAPDKSLSLAEIAAATGASKVGANHLLLQMRQLGQVEKVTGPDGADVFRPGPNWGKDEPPAAPPAATPAAAKDAGPGWMSRALSGVAGFLRTINHDLPARAAEATGAGDAGDAGDAFLAAVFDAVEADDADAFEALLSLLGDAGTRESAVREAAPGPPPRPGLVWNDATKRWRNPDGGDERHPDGLPAAAHQPPGDHPKVAKVTFGTGGETEIKRVFGGRVKDMAHLAAMCNATDGAEMHIEQVPAGYGGIKVTVHNPDGGVAIRSFYLGAGGVVSANNLLFENREGATRPGYELLLDQIKALRAAGVTLIRTSAARLDHSDPKKEMIGYKVWPKLGYEGQMSDAQFARLPKPVREAMGQKRGALGLFGNVPGSRSLRKLYDEVPDGPAEWEKVGDTVDMVFDLSDGSPNMLALERYAAKRRARGPKG